MTQAECLASPHHFIYLAVCYEGTNATIQISSPQSPAASAVLGHFGARTFDGGAIRYCALGGHGPSARGARALSSQVSQGASRSLPSGNRPQMARRSVTSAARRIAFVIKAPKSAHVCLQPPAVFLAERP